MRIGLIDVDGHRFPNLALMRISAYWKSKGANVEWWLGDLFHYDKIYMSKVFSSAYSKEKVTPNNVDEIVKGGTGYAIDLNDGIEKYHKELDGELLADIEKMKPDYSLYPEYRFAVAMTTRGCPRGCAFCHVANKEGQKSIKVANVGDFYDGQELIQVLDPNITACKDKHDLFMQYAETGAKIEFNQGLDIRLLTEQDIDDLNSINIHRLHFAWDNPKDDLCEKFKEFANKFNRNNRNTTLVFVLTNFNSTIDEDLYRIYTLRDLGYNPYVMIYNKPSASQEMINLQRWCNNIWVFRSCAKFEDYQRSYR